MHIGTVRTALFNYLWAKKNGGEFIVRIEDTDVSRNRSEWTRMIFEDFGWCGLAPDKKFIQSEHTSRHRELLEQLVGEGKAYVSKEPAKEDVSREVEVVRLKNPGRSVTFHDEIHGDITFDTTELGDFVIARSLNAPLYHFAVVADDADEEVTHVIRGEDILSSTPRQILIQEALGFNRPVYVHLPLILGTDGKKLSKRRHVVALEEYRRAGFIPGGIINYLALLGWNPGTNEEYFSLDDLVGRFSLDGLQKSGAIFDDIKLLSVNQYWMRKLTDDAYLAHVWDIGCPTSDVGRPTSHMLAKIVPLLKERAMTFGEAREMLGGELGFFFAAPAPGRAGLLTKAQEGRKDQAQNGLKAAQEALEHALTLDSPEQVKDLLMPIAEDAGAGGKGGRGAVLWALRYALTGLDRSPDPFTVIAILGREESAARIGRALDIIRG